MKCADCGTSKACYDCGGCPEHCECEDGFVACECHQVDVDEMDASECPAHGPRSKSYREQLKREVELMFGTSPKPEDGCPF